MEHSSCVHVREARSKIESNGYSNVSGLTKDDNGVWKGKATHSGQTLYQMNSLTLTTTTIGSMTDLGTLV